MAKIFFTSILVFTTLWVNAQDKMFEFSARGAYGSGATFGEQPGLSPNKLSIHGMGIGLGLNYIVNDRFSLGVDVLANEYYGLYRNLVGTITTSLATNYVIMNYGLNLKAYVNPNAKFSLYGRFRTGLTSAAYPSEFDGKPNLGVYNNSTQIPFDPTGPSGYNNFVDRYSGGSKMFVGLGAGVDFNILPILGIFAEISHYHLLGAYKDSLVGQVDQVTYDTVSTAVQVTATDGGPKVLFIEFGAYVRFGNKKF